MCQGAARGGGGRGGEGTGGLRGMRGWQKTRAGGEKEREGWRDGVKRRRKKGVGLRRETRCRQKEKENCRIKKG